MEASKDRVYLFDNLKFILMVFVVWGHLIEPHAGDHVLLKSEFTFIYFFHMPAFIFVSGLFSKGAIGDRARALGRIRYFIILHILLKLFVLAIDIIYYHRFVFDPFTTDGLPWFMLVMAYFYGLTFLLKTVDWRKVLIISVLLACVAGYYESFGAFLCLSRTVVYFPIFYLGYLCDWRKLLEWLKKWYMMVAALLIVLVFAWICFFHLKEIWQVKPLFSGRNPFSTLAWPKWGGLLRLIYYPVVMVFILCLIALTPQGKTIFSKLGGNTLEVYFLHFSIVHALRVKGFFDMVEANYSSLVYYLSFPVIALLITIFFSLPFWTYLFKPIAK